MSPPTMTSPPKRERRAGTLWDFAAGDGDPVALLSFLEGFGAGPAYTKGQLRLFAGDLAGQVRFAPLRGRFPKEIWT